MLTYLIIMSIITLGFTFIGQVVGRKAIKELGTPCCTIFGVVNAEPGNPIYTHELAHWYTGAPFILIVIHSFGWVIPYMFFDWGIWSSALVGGMLAKMVTHIILETIADLAAFAAHGPIATMRAIAEFYATQVDKLGKKMWIDLMFYPPWRAICIYWGFQIHKYTPDFGMPQITHKSNN